MTQKNKKIAVTGGIGSGKSTVCALLREEGFPVFSCDEINDGLWQDEGYLAQLSARFPTCVEGGKPSKKLLAQLIFHDEKARKSLNELAHAEIVKTLNSEMEKFPVAFAEVPLLFEGNYEAQFDEIIVVFREMEARIQSVLERDTLSREEVLSRINSQFNYEKLDGEKYRILYNNGTKTSLKEDLQGILAQILG